jgi:hypothetical protein
VNAGGSGVGVGVGPGEVDEFEHAARDKTLMMSAIGWILI